MLTLRKKETVVKANSVKATCMKSNHAKSNHIKNLPSKNQSQEQQLEKEETVLKSTILKPTGYIYKKIKTNKQKQDKNKIIQILKKYKIKDNRKENNNLQYF